MNYKVIAIFIAFVLGFATAYDSGKRYSNFQFISISFDRRNISIFQQQKKELEFTTQNYLRLHEPCSGE